MLTPFISGTCRHGSKKIKKSSCRGETGPAGSSIPHMLWFTVTPKNLVSVRRGRGVGTHSSRAAIQLGFLLCSKAENGFQVGKWVRDVNLVGQIAGDWIAALKTWVSTSLRGSRCSRILLSFNGGCWTNYTSLPVPVLWYKQLYDERPKVRFYFYMIWIISVILMVQVTDLVFF